MESPPFRVPFPCRPPTSACRACPAATAEVPDERRGRGLAAARRRRAPAAATGADAARVATARPGSHRLLDRCRGRPGAGPLPGTDRYAAAAAELGLRPLRAVPGRTPVQPRRPAGAAARSAAQLQRCAPAVAGDRRVGRGAGAGAHRGRLWLQRVGPRVARAVAGP
ncbi:hypothetical protein G6F57_017645 [Rhizopus arrhizus]|nr:hypothetical protein G6F57_017645 [Rhizopus arrhizus]